MFEGGPLSRVRRDWLSGVKPVCPAVWPEEEEMFGRSFTDSASRLHARKTAIRLVALCGCVFAGLLATSSAASAALVYDNIPTPLPANLPSQPFQAQQTGQYGGQVQLAGTERQDPTVTVMMSSWACQSDPVATCTTTPGATFSHPITLNLYGVLPNGEPGSLIASVTQTFNIPFRPSQSAICGDRRWSPDGTLASCVSGFGNTIQYNLAGRGISLPDRVIIALAYNTETYGEDPIGTDGPYNSLNVALFGAPTVGSLPRPNDGYWDTQTSGNYCDGGTSGVVGVFRLDSGCWNTGSPDFVPYQPAVRVDASITTGSQGPTGPQGGSGPQGVTGSSGGVAGAVATSKKKCKKKKSKASAAKKCKKKK
jgi:hypothetical protein